MFNEAKRDQSKRSNQLDDLLADAKRRAKKDGDKGKPRRPFDLD